jgi:ubiquinone/menaquinone biosynthesis C-methylase UbiE
MRANIYALPGWLYDYVYLLLTLGLEESRVKIPAVRQLDLQPGQTVIDWGCGTGLMLRKIAQEMRAGIIIGVDRIPALLRRARSKRLPASPVCCWFVACDGCATLCFAEPVHAVVASYSLGVIAPEKCRHALEEIHAALRPGGKLLIIDMYRPAVNGLLEQAYYAAHAYFARLLFRQDFSGQPLYWGRRLFREIAYQEYPSLLAFSWVGQKT